MTNGFFAPFRPFFDVSKGRPSIPMGTYVRLLFLKYRFRPGYEQPCVQVNDSLSWRRFCRIGLEARVSDESTTRKLTRCLGSDVVDEFLTITGLLADLAEASLAEADTILSSRRCPRRAARHRIEELRVRIEELRVLVERTSRLIAQARLRIGGDAPAGATRLMSLHEPDARPIAKSRLGRPVEFGYNYKAQLRSRTIVTASSWITPCTYETARC